MLFHSIRKHYMICCGLHRYDIHLHSGKTAVFYMHKLLLYEVGTEKRQSLNFPRQIPIYITYHNVSVPRKQHFYGATFKQVIYNQVHTIYKCTCKLLFNIKSHISSSLVLSSCVVNTVATYIELILFGFTHPGF